MRRGMAFPHGVASWQLTMRRHNEHTSQRVTPEPFPGKQDNRLTAHPTEHATRRQPTGRAVSKPPQRVSAGYKASMSNPRKHHLMGCLLGREQVCGKLARPVAGRRIVAHKEGPRLAVHLVSAPHLGGGFPHHLGEVGGVRAEGLWWVGKIVLGHLSIPGPLHSISQAVKATRPVLHKVGVGGIAVGPGTASHPSLGSSGSSRAPGQGRHPVTRPKEVDAI